MPDWRFFAFLFCWYFSYRTCAFCKARSDWLQLPLAALHINRHRVTSKIRLTMSRVKMSRADRNPWLAKMDQDKGTSLDPFQQTLLQSIEVLQRSVNIINIDQENIAKRLDDLDNRVQQTNFESAVPDPPLGRIKYSVSAHVQTKLEQGLDVRREYECIKNSLTKVKLPNVLRLLDNKSGITWNAKINNIWHLYLSLLDTLKPGADPGYQVRWGAHLKKLRRTVGGANIFGVFCVRNHDFTPKNHIFSNFRGGTRAGGAPPLDPPLETCLKLLKTSHFCTQCL